MGGSTSVRLLTMVAIICLMGSMLVSAPTTSSVEAQSSEGDFPTGPGLNWTMPSKHRLFVNGTSTADNLDRDFPYFTGEPPSESFGIGSNTVIEVSSEPATETVVLSGEAQVYVYASLVAKSDVCRASQFIDGVTGKTSFTIWLDIGTTTVIDGVQSELLAMENAWEGAHEFFVNSTYNNVTFGAGDTIDLVIQSNHNCAIEGRVHWDAYQAATGAVLEGEMLQPELTVTTDSSGLARIEFTPISPWGMADYSYQYLDVVGPLGGWEEARHLKTMPAEEVHVEHFQIPQGERMVEANRTALLWVTNDSLAPGKYMVDACFILTAGDFNEDCDSEDSDHIIAVYRFEVAERNQAMVGSGLFWLASIVSLVSYLGIRIRTTMLPWPTLVLLLVLAISSMAPASTLPDVSIGATRDDSAAPRFDLLQHPYSGQGSISLGELLSGKDALVIGIFQSGSPNAEQQKRDFDNASDRLGDSTSFVQIATGEGVRPTDLDNYASMLNGSWPLLIDESKGEVATQYPTGISDGVIIVDSAGFISTVGSGSMSATQIVNAVDNSRKGSGQSMFDILALVVPTALLLPLVVLALPRKKTEVPETALPPGAGLGGTIGAAGFGFLTWALPLAVLSPMLGGFWSIVELGLMAWLAWQGLSLAIHGEVHEIAFLSRKLYGRMSEGYQGWREESDFTRDVMLGHWVGWISWLAHPMMIPQGVGALASVSLTGLLLAGPALVAYALVAGLAVLIVRVIATIAGPFSRLAGLLGEKETPRLWGFMLIGFAAWWFVWLLTGPIRNMIVL